jgi:hypothetical protein
MCFPRIYQTCKVEFAIELILGTATISKRAYRVSRQELVQLKK